MPSAAGRERFRLRRLVLAAALSAVATAAVLLALDHVQLRREAQRARDLDLSPVALTTDIATVIDLPTGAGNAAEQYDRALERLDDERPRYEALTEQLRRTGVTAEMRLDFACLEPLVAGTTRRDCRCAQHVPRSRGELDSERSRLARMLQLGRLLAAVSRREALRGRPAEAVQFARRLVVLGWHLMGAPASTPGPDTGGLPASARPTTVSVDTRIAGLTLVRWGAHALARLHTDAGDAGDAAAERARVLETDAARTGDALAARRSALGQGLFVRIRVAEDDPDRGFRLLAVILLGEDVAGRRRPLIIGRSRYDAVRDLLVRLTYNPDRDLRAAARHAIGAPR